MTDTQIYDDNINSNSYEQSCLNKNLITKNKSF